MTHDSWRDTPSLKSMLPETRPPAPHVFTQTSKCTCSSSFWITEVQTYLLLRDWQILQLWKRQRWQSLDITRMFRMFTRTFKQQVKIRSHVTRKPCPLGQLWNRGRMKECRPSKGLPILELSAPQSSLHRSTNAVSHNTSLTMLLFTPHLLPPEPFRRNERWLAAKQTDGQKTGRVITNTVNSSRGSDSRAT